MKLTELSAVSPLDGRYAAKVEALRPYVSEFGLYRYRVQVEIHWLLQLSAEPSIPEIPPLSDKAKHYLEKIVETFSLEDAEKIKSFERITNHDVKAVEYFLKEKCVGSAELAPLSEFVHFACTSEDINNLAYALMLKDIRQVILVPHLEALIHQLYQFAHEFADVPMLSRTHGQTASPTTVGKEFANIVARISRQLQIFEDQTLFGKINGAVGNFNAHCMAYPETDWLRLSEQCVTSLGLEWNPYTTQIEPHDYIAEYSHVLVRINTILIDLARDIWGYISLGYFTQRVLENEVGSSTMPHKVNPIDFENAEGNLGIANSLLQHFAEKLPISRWQRDLSDSTVLRNIGSALGYAVLAYHSLEKGLNKLALNSTALQADLDDSWEVLAEAIQTVMRRYGIEQPYEQLKALTRGKRLDQTVLHPFIERQHLPEDVKRKLLALTPANYVGLAAQLAQNI